jgi:hypothetical protein
MVEISNQAIVDDVRELARKILGVCRKQPHAITTMALSEALVVAIIASSRNEATARSSLDIAYLNMKKNFEKFVSEFAPSSGAGRGARWTTRGRANG